MQNALIQVKQKKTKIIFLIIFIFIIIISGLLFWWFKFGKFSSFLVNFNFNSTETQNEKSSNFTDNLNVKTQELTLAKNILDQISTSTDSQGFYGDYQSCDQSYSSCSLNLLDYTNSGELSASYRYGLTVAWARYQYFNQTGDKEQSSLIKNDLKNLVTKVLGSKKWVLQTDSFNCLFMSDIILSNEIDEETKGFAKRLCAEADFERAPDSDVSYDQHNHDLLTFYVYDYSKINQETTKNQVGIIPIPGEKQNQKDLILFEPGKLEASISSNLKKLTNGERNVLKSKVYDEEQPLFMTRELIAAIDQYAGSQILNGNEETKAKNLHWLILTNETLSWFNAHPSLFSNLDICLLKANLSLYLTKHPNTINDDNFAKILNFSNLNFDEQLVCDVANNYSNLNKQSGKEIYKNFQKLDPVYQQKNGYFYPSGIKNIFNINNNAILAGLLGQ